MSFKKAAPILDLIKTHGITVNSTVELNQK